MQKNKSRLFFLTSVLILLTFFHALSFESFHSHHDCIGENCPLCHIIHVLRISLLSLVLLFASGKEFLVYEKFSRKEKQALLLIKRDTLVSYKIKLND